LPTIGQIQKADGHGPSWRAARSPPPISPASNTFRPADYNGTSPVGNFRLHRERRRCERFRHDRHQPHAGQRCAGGPPPAPQGASKTAPCRCRWAAPTWTRTVTSVTIVSIPSGSSLSLGRRHAGARWAKPLPPRRRRACLFHPAGRLQRQTRPSHSRSPTTTGAVLGARLRSAINVIAVNDAPRSQRRDHRRRHRPGRHAAAREPRRHRTSTARSHRSPSPALPANGSLFPERRRDAGHCGHAAVAHGCGEPRVTSRTPITTAAPTSVFVVTDDPRPVVCAQHRSAHHHAR